MNLKKLKPIVDADFIVYRVGFAVKDDEPLEYALATVRSIVDDIADRFIPDRSKMKIYIGGKGNFRNEVAVTNVYKGNRDPANRPRFYDDIREYLIHVHGAVAVDGMEAEDAAGIEQYAHKDKSTILVHQDKDLHCIPGWHWNPVKAGDAYYITKAQADTHFWTQVLTGDRTDNIFGIPKVGPVTAHKLLEPCNGDWVAMNEVVLNRYVQAFGSEGAARMDEVAKLVWILRKEGETYDGSSI